MLVLWRLLLLLLLLRNICASSIDAGLATLGSFLGVCVGTCGRSGGHDALHGSVSSSRDASHVPRQRLDDQLAQLGVLAHLLCVEAEPILLVNVATTKRFDFEEDVL
jgi:hypothetical protein